MTNIEIFEALTIARDAAGNVTLTLPGRPCIRLHPAQARRTGELVGQHDGSASRDLVSLRRRVATIDFHARRLSDWLCDNSDHQHADLSSETTLAGLLADLTGDTVADFGADLARAGCSNQADSGPAATQQHCPRVAR